MPEEFRQVSWQLLPQPNSTVLPIAIDLHLFLPVVEIFGLTDTIIFYVQLTGPVSSLVEFVPESDGSGKSTIVGSLVRQIVVELNGRLVTRNIVIGHAAMSPRPPGAAAMFDAHGASLDWDGEVRCKADTTVGTFDAGCIRVQDFLLIELKPLSAATCPKFVTLRHSHPIKLVTESWVDSSLSRDNPRWNHLRGMRRSIPLQSSYFVSWTDISTIRLYML